MATSKAQIKATNKYITKAYDRLNIVVPKGRRKDLTDHVERAGEGSVNSLVNDLLREHIGMTEAQWQRKPGDPDG